MQFKHLTGKAKVCLFLFLLVSVCIGIFVFLHNGEEKVDLKKKSPDYGLIDGVAYKKSFHGRVDLYENPFFGLKIRFPKGWIIGDQREVTWLVPFEQNKSYLFKSYVKNHYLLRVTAEKSKGGSKKYLENLVKSDYIKLIGPEINGRIEESPIQTSDINTIKINNNKLNYFDASNMGDYTLSNYALKLDDYIIHFQIRSLESKEETHTVFAKLIEHITFE